jgi:hypothetical protein
MKKPPTIINRHMGSAIFNPWAGMGDIDDDEIDRKYSVVDTTDPDQIRRLIREDLAPWLATWSSADRLKARDAIRYFVVTDKRLDWIIDAEVLPFDVKDADLFFQLIWQELFPGDNLAPIEGERFRDINQIWEPMGIHDRAAKEAAKRQT